jgi:MFS family permease
MHDVNQSKSNKKFFIAGMFGNVLDHYDMALYTFLVPFIAPVFFPGADPIAQLIMAYGVTVISLISRPIGSILFGSMAMKIGAKFVLCITLTGVACSTCLIGFIPGYDSIGVWGAIILVIVRFVQGVFASGEQSVAGLFVLDQVKETSLAKASSYYQASSMTGAMMASGVAWFVSWSGHGDTYWRYAFISGLVTGLIGLILRFMVLDYKIKAPSENQKVHKIFIKYRLTILRIILVSSLSYMTFAVPFVFLNKFIPILTDVTLTQMMGYNSVIMGLDILLLPILGHIAQKYNIAKWMGYMTLLLGTSAIPAFYMLDKVPFYGIIGIKLWFVIVGLAISAPLRAWLFGLINSSERYMITGFGYAIGMSVLGGQTTTICWILWHETHNIVAPACYVMVLSFAAVWALLYKENSPAALI